MTREEKIELLEKEKAYMIGHGGDRQAKALDSAIKELKQEPVLDKIRAEIEEEMLSHSGTGEEVIQAYADGLKKGLAIIDKYKSESEDEQC
jgi:nucleotide-binding universal stress UspA family protein